MNKKVILYADSKDAYFGDVKGYLEEQEVNLQVHNIGNSPLNQPEISSLVQHFNLQHFLNTKAKSYKKNKLDNSLPERQELIELIAKDNDLLIRPIIVYGRLTAVGYDRHAIKEMLLETPRETSKRFDGDN
jgi:regulatory protein spx